MKRIIDFHAHILPGCDHGSNGVQTSLQQLALAKQAGVDLVCATPHFYPTKESIDSFLLRRAKCHEKLMSALQQDVPEIRLGAEVLAFPGMDSMDNLEKLCLEGSHCLLLEMPYSMWSRRLVDSVELLHESHRVEIILAHADRYDPEAVEELLDMGIRVQLNADNACRLFGIGHLRNWLSRDCVAAIGSDIHGTAVGYRKWNRCRKKQKKFWNQVMDQANELVGTF